MNHGDRKWDVQPSRLGAMVRETARSVAFIGVLPGPERINILCLRIFKELIDRLPMCEPIEGACRSEAADSRRE